MGGLAVIIDCKYDCLAGKARERFVRREFTFDERELSALVDLLLAILKFGSQAPYRTVLAIALLPRPLSGRRSHPGRWSCECVRQDQSAIFLLKRGGRARCLDHRHLSSSPLQVGDTCGKMWALGGQQRRAPSNGAPPAGQCRCHGKWAPFASAAADRRRVARTHQLNLGRCCWQGEKMWEETD